MAASPRECRPASYEAAAAATPPSAGRDEHMVDPQHDDGADHGDEHAVEIEAGHANRAEGMEDEAADQRADDPEQDVDEEAGAAPVDDLARDPARDQAEYQPADDRH